jgi:imipenem/basic amino acid-specific outer membrane pore
MAGTHLIHGICAVAVLACTAAHADAQADAKGFVEGSSLTMLNRLVYEQLDYQRGNTTRTVAGGPRSSEAREGAYGLMLNYSSGYTRGMVGLGLDAHAVGGINLGSDADSVRSNPRYIAKDGNQLKDSFWPCRRRAEAAHVLHRAEVG